MLAVSSVLCIDTCIYIRVSCAHAQIRVPVDTGRKIILISAYSHSIFQLGISHPVT
jgi:hypothetical protein